MWQSVPPKEEKNGLNILEHYVCLLNCFRSDARQYVFLLAQWTVWSSWLLSNTVSPKIFVFLFFSFVCIWPELEYCDQSCDLTHIIFDGTQPGQSETMGSYYICWQGNKPVNVALLLPFEMEQSDKPRSAVLDAQKKWFCAVHAATRFKYWNSTTPPVSSIVVAHESRVEAMLVVWECLVRPSAALLSTWHHFTVHAFHWFFQKEIINMFN
jgi:hypothetical protein